MEQNLKRLEEQEQKYSAELDAALNEYAGLREQAQGFDPVQLHEARHAIRPGKEQEAENRVQQVYGEKYSPLLMFDSKKAVSRMLNEDIEQQAVRRMVRQAQKEHPILSQKKMIRDRSGDAISVPYLLLLVIGLPYTAQTAISLGTTHPSALLILYKHNSKSC